MAITFVENTSSSPKTYFGKLLQPGESAWVESVPDPSPGPKQPLSQDPISKKVYAGNDEVPRLSSLVSGAGNLQGGNVLIDWSSCAIGAPTAGWYVTLDPARTYGGKPSLRVHTNGVAPSGGTTLICTITLPSAAFLGGAKRLLLPVAPSDKAVSGDGTNPIQLWVNLSGGTTHRLMSYLAGGGGSDGEWLLGGPYSGDASGSGHITGTEQWIKLRTEDVTAVRIVMTCVAGGIPADSAAYVGPLIGDAYAPPTLTIFADGNYAGQHKYMRSLLAQYGLRASLASVPYWMTEARAGIMTPAQMDSMISDGHEAIHHTGTTGPAGNVDVGWDNVAKYPPGQEYALVKADVEASQAYFRSRGWTKGLGYGVIGFTNGLSGTQSLARRRDIMRGLRDGGLRHIRQLGGYTQSHFEHADHSPLVKQVTTMLQTSTAYSTANVQSLIDKLILRGGWTGITYHDIVLTGESGNNRNVDVVAADLDYIGSKVRSGDLRVLLMSEAIPSLPAPR